MRIIYVIGLILMLFLSACASQQPQPQAAPQPQPTPQAPVEEPQPEDVEAPVDEDDEDGGELVAAAGGDIRILGKDGFDPEELKVSVGSTVSWINEGDIGVTVNFMRNKRAFMVEYIKPGEMAEVTFDEAETIEFEAMEFRTSGTIIVE